MRVKLVVEYDGRGFVGFQAQPPGAGRTVQRVLEEALRRLTGQRVRVHASGRTDAGVHAWGQVVHVDLDGPVPPERIAEALNGVLPPDVAVADAGRAADTFHARKSAVRKAYEYLIWSAPRRSPLLRGAATWVRAPLDVALMKKAAADFVGRHDFAAFTSADRSVRTTVRTVFQSEVTDVSARLPQTGEAVVEAAVDGAVDGATDAARGALLAFRVQADGFLMHMVRVMAGTLIDVGRGKLPPDTVRQALASGRRADAGPTAAPQGLYLTRVGY